AFPPRSDWSAPGGIRRGRYLSPPSREHRWWSTLIVPVSRPRLPVDHLAPANFRVQITLSLFVFLVLVTRQEIRASRPVLPCGPRSPGTPRAPIGPVLPV